MGSASTLALFNSTFYKRWLFLDQMFVVVVVVVVCFLGFTIHCGCIFHSTVAAFSFLVFEVS
jgi:hypothetical protein